VAFNRINVFLVAYQPPYVKTVYFPSIFEIAVTVGLIATLALAYRLIVTYLPVITHPDLTARRT
jgi:Ni/Fe-hydrogenase subunit HybB-like protein